MLPLAGPLRQRSLAFALAGALALATSAPTAPYCQPGQLTQFADRFGSLVAVLGDTLGQPVECQHTEAATGDLHQHSTAGLVYLRRATGAASFTDGRSHWALVGGVLANWDDPSSDPPQERIELPAEPVGPVRGPGGAVTKTS